MRVFVSSLLRYPSRLVLTTLPAILLLTAPAKASKLWNWHYSTSSIAASGTFTTVDNPNADGGFLITNISGTRNGLTITGLQRTGTSIPGNEPFVVDNLVFSGPGPQLTSHGFGFSISNGDFSNPFFADFLPTPGYLEFLSIQPANGGSDHTELPIRFSATPVPEPAPVALILGGLVLAGFRRRSHVA